VVSLPRIGVLGSLCNPPHIGHLLLCEHAAEQLELDRVVIVPTGLPSHRPEPPETPAQRVRLAQAAADGNPLLTVSRLEVDRPGPSYMADTLHALGDRYSGSTLVLLMGADQFRSLPSWHEPRTVARLAQIAVAARPGSALAEDELERAFARIVMPQLEISSSAIRERAAAGRSIRYLVTEPVRELVEREGLYRDRHG
jgi:nicotinate-nucleotide adenylyltransferase